MCFTPTDVIRQAGLEPAAGPFGASPKLVQYVPKGVRSCSAIATKGGGAGRLDAFKPPLLRTDGHPLAGPARLTCAGAWSNAPGVCVIITTM